MEELKEIKVRTNWQIGEKYELRIIGKSKEFVYVDCGDKKEGLIDAREFQEGSFNFDEDQIIEAYYVGVFGGFRHFTTLHKGFSTLDLKRIREAYEEKRPLEGKVVKVKKGGFEVSVGSVNCFCPYSHMGEKGENPDNLVGKVFNFRVLSIGEDGGNILLSRRILLEEEREKRKGELRNGLLQGSKITGIVERITGSGAVIDLGGLKAYLPRSEVSWTYVRDMRDFLKEGMVVEAMVKEADWEKERIILSIRELTPDPLLEFAKKFEKESRASGIISKVLPSGLWVKLEGGLEGFVPLSKLGLKRKVEDLTSFFKEGEEVEVVVLDVDLGKRRILLTMKEEEPLNLPYPEIGDLVECVIQKILERGIIVETSSGIEGYIPEGELNFPGDKAKSRHYRVGMKIKGVVLDLDKKRGRLLMSEKRVEEVEERKAYETYKEKIEKEQSPLGTLGELLKETLK